MKINTDYSLALRTGIKIDKHIYKKQQEGGVLVMGIGLGISLFIIFSVGMALIH